MELEGPSGSELNDGGDDDGAGWLLKTSTSGHKKIGPMRQLNKSNGVSGFDWGGGLRWIDCSGEPAIRSPIGVLELVAILASDWRFGETNLKRGMH